MRTEGLITTARMPHHVMDEDDFRFPFAIVAGGSDATTYNKMNECVTDEDECWIVSDTDDENSIYIH
jgi:hypothetical protein